ncbi:histidine kinase [Thioploca ingrica]|uniref:histidine kinase n=1 Tax=Thioploca ingrica TaxID=40754 RepID=A0A090AF68_9GAMM|nr:histidine kinase [Thioploca ingrica]
MKIYHRLRTKLSIAFIIVTLIPTLIIGIYAIQVASQTLQAQTLAQQTEQVKILENLIRSFLSIVKSDLSFLSQSAPLREYLNLHMVLMSDSQVESVPTNSTEATQQAVHNILEQKQTALEQEFLAFSRSRQIYYQIRYLDEMGQEIARVDADESKSWIVAKKLLQNNADQDDFKGTMRLSSKQLFISKLDLNREQGQIEVPHKPVIRYAVNVYYPNNQRAGIVTINVNPNQFLQALGDAFLIDQEGFFLHHPNPKKEWGGPNDLKTGVTFEKDYPQIVSQVLNKNGTLSTNTAAISYQRIIVPGSSQQWTLLVLHHTREIFQSIIEFRLAFNIILAIAILIAIWFAIILSAKITRPIEQLTRIAEAISRGELIENRVEIHDKSEIGQLAQAFERMRVSMIKSFEKLRKQSRM